MITREHAVELVEALLERTRHALPAYPRVAVVDVEEHALGWLVSWQSVAYIRSGNPFDMLIGSGPYLVDRQDGSIHHIPVTTYMHEPWEELYLEQIKGMKPADPLRNAVRDVMRRAGAMAALRYLRRQASQLGLLEAKTYVDALRDGHEPPEDVVSGLRPRPAHPPLPIATVAGPAEPRCSDGQRDNDPK